VANKDDQLVLTPEEARKILRCSRGVIYEGIRRGTVPSARISPRKILIPRAALVRMLVGVENDGAQT